MTIPDTFSMQFECQCDVKLSYLLMGTRFTFMRELLDTVPSHLVAKRSNFSKGDKVGRAAWGSVYRGTDLRQNPPRPVAIKVFRTDFSWYGDRRIFTRAISVMCKLQHKWTRTMIAVVRPSAPDEKTMLVFPWMEHGTLEDVLERERSGNTELGWDATKKSIVVFGTAVIMAYIHSQSILHRNLRLDNIFLNEHFEPFVGDFALACVEAVNMTKGVGTPLYMAPELSDDNESEDYTKAIDVYAYAVTLFQIFTDSRVLDDSPKSPESIADLMLRMRQGARLARVPGIPDFLWNLIQMCWAQKAADRPSFVEIVRMLREHEKDWVFPGINPVMFQEYQQRIVQGIDL